MYVHFDKQVLVLSFILPTLTDDSPVSRFLSYQCCKSECVAEDYFCNGVGDGEHKCLDSSSEDFSGTS